MELHAPEPSIESNKSLTSVSRKKSVLKVRQPTINNEVEKEKSTVLTLESSNDLNQQDSNFQDSGSLPKRNVTFRDGIRPGDDASDSGCIDVRSSDANQQNPDQLYRIKKVC